MKKLFGEINLTWTKLIIFAIVAAVYTAIVAILPIAKDTSFADISISFEVWILFGIIIIMNSKSARDSALKCFVFFLISQPLIYLLQVPFSWQGWNLFKYYKFWFIWTLLTIPMGYIGYYMKKDKWWGLIILTPMLIFLGFHYVGFLRETISFFPHHFISTIFCLITTIIYPLVIFKNQRVKIIGLIISIIIILVMTIISIIGGKTSYDTTILISNASQGVEFDDTYKVYLKDKEYGNVYIIYENNIEEYMVNASFSKIGKTEFILESPNGDKTIFDINIERDSYHIEKKKADYSLEADTKKKLDNQWKTENVKIMVKENSITKTSADIVIEDNNEEPVFWGVNFAIQISAGNDKWLDMITKETIAWVELAISPNENGITEMHLDWSEIYGELNEGTYRVVKYNGLSTLYSEPFIIK